MISSFPKIFAIGTNYISAIFEGEVEVTEKIDGSQFVFGKIDGELQMRSKGAMIEDIYRKPSDLFYPAIQHVLSIQESIPDNTVFYCETLCKPKHNVLTYGSVPTNNIMLYGVQHYTTKGMYTDWESLNDIALYLNIGVVPLLHRGAVDSPEQLHSLLESDSVLGGCKIEGFVVKNYGQPFLLGGQPIPVMCGKYVSEAFKEVHRATWTSENTGRGKWDLFKEGFRTDARWDKAIIHLKEKGELESSPKDIGKLMAAIKTDIEEEEKESIKAFLWNEFGSEVLRTASKGFPEYYKKKLLEGAFHEEK